ncbi:3-keto-5-aminohexanoate cleavage protein [Modestobacter sp. SYSU DS0875]
MSTAGGVEGTLITLAPTGAESAKADVPALPVTVDEVVATARDCQALGAAVLHLHVRDADTRPTLDLPRVREVVGGHLRVGMEDTLSYAPGEPVRDNAQLVARAAGLARIAQRPLLSPVQARQLLGIGATDPVQHTPVEVAP